VLPVFRCFLHSAAWVRRFGGEISRPSLANDSPGAGPFCFLHSAVLGNPDAFFFFRDLGNWGLAFAGQAIFPDHTIRFTSGPLSGQPVWKRDTVRQRCDDRKDAQKLVVSSSMEPPASADVA